MRTPPRDIKTPLLERGLASWEGSALVGTRTPNLLIRSQMLYPIELQALVHAVAPLASGARRPHSGADIDCRARDSLTPPGFSGRTHFAARRGSSIRHRRGSQASRRRGLPRIGSGSGSVRRPRPDVRAVVGRSGIDRITSRARCRPSATAPPSTGPGPTTAPDLQTERRPAATPRGLRSDCRQPVSVRTGGYGGSTDRCISVTDLVRFGEKSPDANQSRTSNT